MKTQTTIAQPSFDSRLGIITEGMKLFSRIELETWLKNNRLQVEGRIKREIGQKSGLAEMLEGAGLQVKSAQDPAPMPGAFIVASYRITGSKLSMHLRRGTESKPGVDYDAACKAYVLDAQKWLADATEGTRTRFQQLADKRKQEIEWEASRMASVEVREARALIERDSKLAPGVADARAAINPKYSKDLERAAALVNLETQSLKTKKPLAMLYAQAKAARKI